MLNTIPTPQLTSYTLKGFQSHMEFGFGDPPMATSVTLRNFPMLRLSLRHAFRAQALRHPFPREGGLEHGAFQDQTNELNRTAQPDVWLDGR